MLLDALRYVENGFSVVPCAPGGKRPIVRWKRYQIERPTIQQVLKWFNGREANIAVIGGRVSGGLSIIDFDTEEAWNKGSAAVDGLPIVRTRKGYHAYLRTELMRNYKLAMNESGKVMVEIRGQGGYAVAPPSTHRYGKYTVISGNIIKPPVLSKKDATDILSRLKKMDCRKDRVINYTAGKNGSGDKIIVPDKEDYVSRIMERELLRLRESVAGTRNMSLFVASCNIGELVAGDSIGQFEAQSALVNAAAAIGLLQEDGRSSVYQTIKSGFNKGSRNPMIVVADPLFEGI